MPLGTERQTNISCLPRPNENENLLLCIKAGGYSFAVKLGPYKFFDFPAVLVTCLRYLMFSWLVIHSVTPRTDFSTSTLPYREQPPSVHHDRLRWLLSHWLKSWGLLHKYLEYMPPNGCLWVSLGPIFGCLEVHLSHPSRESKTCTASRPRNSPGWL